MSILCKEIVTPSFDVGSERSGLRKTYKMGLCRSGKETKGQT